MLKFHFDPKKRYCVVVYLRMSSKMQNERSPEQQLNEIKRRLKLLGYNWVIAKIYRDEAKSGRLLHNRPEYQRMLNDIHTGKITVDLILVDTIERFGRGDNLQIIRNRLFEKNGVLVLTGDTNFADPTTPQGQAMSMFESMRSSDDSRIKAHNVLRGKRDVAELQRWPGAKDEVDLPRGGRRGPNIDVSLFADEARMLWEAGASKRNLAKKFKCSEPVINRALAFAYEKDGLQVPATQDSRMEQIEKARQLHADGHSLVDIARALNISNVTARTYLGESFASEGKPMPDLRSRDSK